MHKIVNIFLIINIISYCNGTTFREQLEQIARRFYNNPGEKSVILGAPSMASHLPEAESILPGHTLIRPALGMLKSAVRFPHRALETGAGVYGNMENLGIRYDGKNERVQYSGFRRMPERYNKNEKRRENTFDPIFIKIIPPRSKNIRIKKDKKIYGSKLSNNPIQTLLLSTSNVSHEKNKRHGKPTGRPGYAYVNLEDIGVLRTGEGLQGGNTIKKLAYNIEEIPSDSSDDEDLQEGSADNAETAGYGQESGHIAEGKKAWFWKTKEAYNHIKIDPEAPELEDLMPSHAAPKLRDWWFYHQGDFQPLDIV